MTCRRCSRDFSLPTNPVGRKPEFCPDCRKPRILERQRAHYDKTHGPRIFVVAIQWRPGDIATQEDGLTFSEAFEAVEGFRNAPRPPHRVAMALVQKGA